MTGGDPMMPPDLDRLLANADVPAMSAGLIDRIVAEAARPGRTALPVARAPRSRGRRWTRRGVWSGIVAVNLMLATAVAAAFGGGALTFATIATVARHVVDHIRAPFHHAGRPVVPGRHVVIHRLAVPAAAIATTPRIAFPVLRSPVVAAPSAMDRSRSFVVPPPVVRPRPVHPTPLDGSRHRSRWIAANHAPSPMHAGPYAIRHSGSGNVPHDRARDRPRDVGPHRHAMGRSHPLRDARAPGVLPKAPSADPLPRAEPSIGRDTPNGERGLQGEGGRRFDDPRGQTPAAAAAGTEGRADERAGVQGQGQDRTPGWRRRMLGNNPAAGAPGWRRRAGLNGGGPGRPGGRMKPPRPGGGGRHRRF